MAAELCKHDLPVAQCGTCTPPVRQPSQQRFGKWFPASFGSECDGCGDDIGEGDQIRSDGDGGWLCSRCGSGQP